MHSEEQGQQEEQDQLQGLRVVGPRTKEPDRAGVTLGRFLPLLLRSPAFSRQAEVFSVIMGRPILERRTIVGGAPPPPLYAPSWEKAKFTIGKIWWGTDFRVPEPPPPPPPLLMLA